MRKIKITHDAVLRKKKRINIGKRQTYCLSRRMG